VLLSVFIATIIPYNGNGVNPVRYAEKLAGEWTKSVLIVILNEVKNLKNTTRKILRFTQNDMAFFKHVFVHSRSRILIYFIEKEMYNDLKPKYL